MTIKPRVDVAAGILVDADGRILIGERPATSQHSPNLWEFPGGKLEAGETAYEALKRELVEEIAVTIADATLLATHRHDYRERDVMLYFFVVREWYGEVVSLEGQRLAWALPQALPSYRMLPGDEPLVRDLPRLLEI